jgi:hypothetical protein
MVEKIKRFAFAHPGMVVFSLICFTMFLWSQVIAGVLDPDTTGIASRAAQATKYAALGFNLLMGVLSVPITTWVAKRSPWLAGHFVPILSAAIGIGFIYGGFLLFHLSIFDNPDFFHNAVAALGINETAGQVFYEWLQNRPKKPAAAATSPS